MLKSLKLTNFRSAENVAIEFTPGMNIFRGVSESGKSTRLEAILYALIGSKGISETLAKVVTYGKPEASLRVELDFVVGGVDYKIVRHKGGAELRYSDQVVVGQLETRAFVERLLGCSADMMKNLMIADQNSIRGVLSAGSTAAGSLVEKLADLEVIEALIDRIQAHKIFGNTRALDAQVAQAEASLGEAPVAPSDAVVQAAQNRWTLAVALIAEKQALWGVCAPKITHAESTLARAAEALRERSFVASTKARLTLEAAPVAPPSITQADVDQARVLANDEAAAAKRRKAYATKFPVCGLEWDESYEDLLRANAAAVQALKEASAEAQNLRVKLATVKAMRINEDVCSFCKKDISDLPEVASRNAEVSAQEMTISTRIVELKNTCGLLEGEIAAYAKIVETTAKIKALAGDSWSLSSDVPPKPTWIGEVPPEAGTVPDVAGMEKQLRDYAVKVVKVIAAQEQLEKLVEPELVDIAEAEVVVAEAAKLKTELAKLVSAEAEALRSLETAKASFASDLRIYRMQVAQAVAAKEQVKQLKTTLADMVKHNNLLKKLRDARPEIVTQLWNTVLGTISHYFSTIRGTASVLTRTADGFQVNGHSVDGLSGSTKDALGLAIRIALSKTFLPSMPLLIVDEPFAGCSAGREVDGLGLLASCGFDQVLLVTHSELGDSFAANLVAVG